ncbi:MAG: S41 family peptidase [Victivallaceae bacterium]
MKKIKWFQACCLKTFLPLILACLMLFATGAVADDQAAIKTSNGKIEPGQSGNDAYSEMALFVTVMELLRKYYVDKDRVSYHHLITGALKGMLQELDPYSIYEGPALYKKNVERFAGQQVGIGIVVLKETKSGLKVVSAVAGSPAMKAGVKAGDIITDINGKNLNGMGLEEAVNLIQGIAGTEVTLTILRPSSDVPLTVKVKRSVIIHSPVPHNGVLVFPGGIGYIRLTMFSAQTAPALDAALKKLIDQDKVKGLILDLRNNPGGLLGAAVEVCSRFLEQGKLIISTEGRYEKDNNRFYATGCTKYLDIPLIVLVNHYSASSAEIVAGCLRDHKRAVLVGSRTYGKASVQRLQKLPDNGAIRFTIAKYYTPERKLIHGQGIATDIEVELPLKQRLQLANQMASEPGRLKSDKPDTVADIQLERALQVISGIIKYRESKQNE